MIQRLELVNDWYYRDCYTPGMEATHSLEGFSKINLPHANLELPYQYLDETTFQFISCYKHEFQTPRLEKGQVAWLRFEGVMTYAQVYLNGKRLGEHKGGYTPFSFSVANLLIPDGKNEITVVVDSTERNDIPPFGGQIDYLTYGGIYREVYLDIYEPVHIKNARIEPIHVLEKQKGLKVDFWVDNTDRSITIQAALEMRLLDEAGNTVYQAERALVCPSGQSHVIMLFEAIEPHGNGGPIQLWTLENPALYTAQLTLRAGNRADLFTTRIGFRSAEFRPEGFFLNGQRTQLVGLNRHQSWPYVGYAMPKRAQCKDADILKFDLHVNLVRTSHYPQSIHFLNRCDEIGLLVLEEIPGWQHIGNEEWQQVAQENVREMVERDWNHPSIIMWQVRINESADNHDFYTQTNSIARTLDPSRAIGGTRCIENSELLEDVYTMNDFSEDQGASFLRQPRQVTGLDVDVPYLITEFGGHMYPTKKTDCEERQMGHVNCHLNVQRDAFANPWISGAIGWCLFDYNTHKDFGSGDRICHHGVMDMFRIKKFAAYVYKSQISPEIEPVLMPVTFWARGERSIGGILPLIVLSNCDYLTIQYGEHPPLTISRKSDEFKDLPYPPFVINFSDFPPNSLGDWGMCWEDGIISGYINNQKVIEKQYAKNPVPAQLLVQPDDRKLDQGSKDVTRVLVSVLDQKGNVLPFADTIVQVSLTGPARIQGPGQFSLKGGSFGFYVESSGEPGVINVQVESDGFPGQAFTIEVA